MLSDTAGVGSPGGLDRLLDRSPRQVGDRQQTQRESQDHSRSDRDTRTEQGEAVDGGHHAAKRDNAGEVAGERYLAREAHDPVAE
jgi:hypothetical protein